jgi:alkylation response protein AidB-like acyl-CoA dehydrogenase
MAHAERDSRFAIDAVRTTATADADGYKLVGQKSFVLAGHHADQILVSARTSDGIGLFVVDRESPGVTTQPVRTMDGHGAAELRLDTAIAADRRLIGAGKDAQALLERVYDYAAAAACAESVGLAESVLSMSGAHLKEREQFGVAIGTFQVLQHYAVDMFVHVELMRSMSTLASVRASDPDDELRRHGVSAAKAHVARSGRFVTQKAIQLHGGIGITDEHDVGLFFKRMHVLGTLFGDEDHHVRRFSALPAFTAGLT